MTNYCYDFFSYRNKKKLDTETQRHGEEKRIKAVLFEGKITEEIIESAIEVHRHLGPGLLEVDERRSQKTGIIIYSSP